MVATLAARAPESSRTAVRRFVELLTLSALSLSAPLFAVLADGPEFFVNVRATANDILIVTFLLCVLLPSVLWLVEQIFTLISARASIALHHLFLVLLLICFFCRLLTRHAGFSGASALLAAAAVGILFVGCKLRVAWPTKLLSIISPLSVVAPLFFLASPGISSLLFPKSRAAYVQHSGGKPTTPVVLAVFDEFPLNVLLDKDLKVDAVRYPNIAAFAEQAHWFKNASSINQFTPLAVPAILSGRFPASPRQLPTVETYPVNLFTALAGTHKLKVYEPFTRLCPPELCQRPVENQPRALRLQAMASDIFAIILNIVVPQDIGFKIPDIDGKWGDFWGEDEQEWEPPNFSRDARVADFQKFIASLSASAEPTLYFSHVVLPHMPYQFLPSGRGYKKSGPHAYIGNRWIDDAALIRVAYQQFLLQTAAADALFGRLIARLKEIGVYDQALVILAADHGVSFQVGTYRRGHPQHPSFYEDILNVPLFVKLPFQKTGSVEDRNVETIDILPTILEVLHLDPLEQAAGRSMLGTSVPREKKQVLIGRVPEGRTRRSDAVADWGADLAGSTIDLDPPKEFPHATVDWKYALPGYQTPNPFNVYFIGPHSELLGRELASMHIGKASGAALQFFDRRAPVAKDGTVHFKKNSPQCPCSFSATLSGDGFKAGSEVAVAVNGILQSFGTVMESQSTALPHFSVFVSDSAYKEGENRVEFFGVVAAPDGLQFSPLRIE